MAISPISAATTAATAASRSMATQLPSLPSVNEVAGAGAVNADGGFGNRITQALGTLNDLHLEADDLAIQAATGDLSDIHEYTIAASEAEIATQLTVAVRDRAVEAFNDIMHMQF